MRNNFVSDLPIDFEVDYDPIAAARERLKTLKPDDILLIGLNEESEIAKFKKKLKASEFERLRFGIRVPMEYKGWRR